MLTDRDSIAFLGTAQPEQVRAFYSEVWGLRLIEDTPFALYVMLMARCYVSKGYRYSPQPGIQY
jgi:hypothetical protein